METGEERMREWWKDWERKGLERKKKGRWNDEGGWVAAFEEWRIDAEEGYPFGWELGEELAFGDQSRLMKLWFMHPFVAIKHNIYPHRLWQSPSSPSAHTHRNTHSSLWNLLHISIAPTSTSANHPAAPLFSNLSSLPFLTLPPLLFSPLTPLFSSGSLGLYRRIESLQQHLPNPPIPIKPPHLVTPPICCTQRAKNDTRGATNRRQDDCQIQLTASRRTEVVSSHTV